MVFLLNGLHKIPSNYNLPFIKFTHCLPPQIVIFIDMKKTTRLTYLLLLLATAFTSHAQYPPATTDTLLTAVEQTYQHNQPDSLYLLTGSRFRKAISAAQLAGFWQQLHAGCGNWLSSTFLYQQNQTAVYQVRFEKNSQLLELTPDSTGSIDGLRLTPVFAGATQPDKTMATSNTRTTPEEKRIHQLLLPYTRLANTTGLIIAVIDKDKITTCSYGETRRGSKQLPDASKSVFEIGSVTKTFTGLLLADAIIEKQVTADDAIDNYLPDSIPGMAYQGRPITLQTLSNHTSGFPRLPANIGLGVFDPQDPYLHYDTSSMFSYLAHFHPYRAPGTVYEYSNFGAGLLGQLLASHYHTTYEQLLTATILLPLHMNHTGITLAAGDSAWQVQGYNEKAIAVSPWHFTSLAGAGAIRSTLADMVIYIRANLGKAPSRLLPAIELAQQPTFTNGKQTTALGWHTDVINGHTTWWHDGGTAGFRSFVAFDKETQKGVILLSNATEDLNHLGLTILQ